MTLEVWNLYSTTWAILLCLKVWPRNRALNCRTCSFTPRARTKAKKWHLRLNFFKLGQSELFVGPIYLFWLTDKHRFWSNPRPNPKMCVSLHEIPIITNEVLLLIIIPAGHLKMSFSMAWWRICFIRTFCCVSFWFYIIEINFSSFVFSLCVICPPYHSSRGLVRCFTFIFIG